MRASGHTIQTREGGRDLTASADTLQRACALCNTDVLLPADIPLGNNTQRAITPIHMLTRMQDALQTLLHGAQTIPDFERVSWTQRELGRLALRAFQGDTDKAARLLGVSPASLKVEAVKAKARKAS